MTLCHTWSESWLRQVLPCLRDTWDSLAIERFTRPLVIVVALYYVLFAVISSSVQTVVLESVVMSLFAIAAVVGFKSSAWIVVAAGLAWLLRHGFVANDVRA